jgi:hypothetical protein
MRRRLRFGELRTVTCLSCNEKATSGGKVLRTASDECRRQRMSVQSIGSNYKNFFY